MGIMKSKSEEVKILKMEGGFLHDLIGERVGPLLASDSKLWNECQILVCFGRY